MTNNTLDYDNNLYFPKPKEGENSFKATFDSHFSLKKAEGLKIKNNLTIDWENGKLPEGYYYVKDGENMIAEYLDGYFYNNGEPMTSFNGGVDSVLAPVPSYEEYEQLENWARFTDDYHALKEKLEIAEYENTELLEKVKQLKELLKECSGLFNRSTVDGEEPNNEELIMILTKIEEVLK